VPEIMDVRRVSYVDQYSHLKCEYTLTPTFPIRNNNRHLILNNLLYLPSSPPNLSSKFLRSYF
ncbi:MAG: hypothetical protein JRN15_23475, partial [Nitrososphaerota archaeon]|nr:hypothetical protein [Nitrososphaerota archaeon]